MKVTSHLLTVAATALLAATVWAQNSSSSQTPPIRPEAQPPYSPGGARPGIDPSSSQTPPIRPEAQPPYSPGGARTPGVNPSDTTEGQTQPAVDPMISARKFVKEAAQGSATEIALGKLAQEKGSSDAVKQFGKRMVEDHSKATEELKQAAEMAKIQVPSEPPKKAKKAQDKLSKLSGADFDRAYAKTMVSDHKEDVKAFEKEARDGSVPPVKNFAAKTLPTLEEHLKLAEELDAAAGKGSETSK
jgi:putative membrane protein